MQNKCPQRKQIRLKGYDYRAEGYYFITICTKNRKQILSKILINLENKRNNSVGVAPQGDPQIKLTKIGQIAEKYLHNYNKKFENISLHEYVIMPNHIHFIIELLERVAEGGDPYNT